MERSPLRVGDIVLAQDRRGKLYAHRVIRFQRRGEENLIITKGDNTRLPDPAFTRRQILGRIEKVETKKGG